MKEGKVLRLKKVLAGMLGVLIIFSFFNFPSINSQALAANKVLEIPAVPDELKNYQADYYYPGPSFFLIKNGPRGEVKLTWQIIVSDRLKLPAQFFLVRNKDGQIKTFWYDAGDLELTLRRQQEGDWILASYELFDNSIPFNEKNVVYALWSTGGILKSISARAAFTFTTLDIDRDLNIFGFTLPGPPSDANCRQSGGSMNTHIGRLQILYQEIRNGVIPIDWLIRGGRINIGQESGEPDEGIWEGLLDRMIDNIRAHNNTLLTQTYDAIRGALQTSLDQTHSVLEQYITVLREKGVTGELKNSPDLDQIQDECLKEYASIYITYLRRLSVTQRLIDALDNTRKEATEEVGECGSPLRITKYIPCLLAVTLNNLAMAVFKLAVSLVTGAVGL